MPRFTAKEKRLLCAIRRTEPQVARSAMGTSLGSDSAATRTKKPSSDGGSFKFRQVDLEELLLKDARRAFEVNKSVNKFTQECLQCAVSNTAHLSQIETKP